MLVALGFSAGKALLYYMSLRLIGWSPWRVHAKRCNEPARIALVRRAKQIEAAMKNSDILEAKHGNS
jgi:hypothetical protein